MAREIYSVIQRARTEASEGTPLFVRKITPLLDRGFSPNTYLYSLICWEVDTEHGGRYVPTSRFDSYLKSFGLTGEEKYYIVLTVKHLGDNLVYDNPVSRKSLDIDLATDLVKGGLLDYLDEFKDDRIRREVAKALLGL
jgi:hypothetical protein